MTFLRLDHLAVSAHSRDEARAYVEDALGLSLQVGGAHAHFGTHNHLLGLVDDLYLEAISIDPDAENPKMPRWFDLDSFEGPPKLTNWICSTADLGAACVHWPEAGEAVALTRGDLRWEMAVPSSGKLPFDGMFPAIMSWASKKHPSQMLSKTDAKLKMLTVCHKDADALSARLGLIEGAPIRFEVSNTPRLVAEIETPHARRR